MTTSNYLATTETHGIYCNSGGDAVAWRVEDSPKRVATNWYVKSRDAKRFVGEWVAYLVDSLNSSGCLSRSLFR